MLLLTLESYDTMIVSQCGMVPRKSEPITLAQKMPQ